MIFQDTPNPNAKKIEIKHNFELGINLSEKEILVDSELNFFLNHEVLGLSLLQNMITMNGKV